MLGVSNYALAQIDELRAGDGPPPRCGPGRVEPGLFDRDVLEGHRRRGVQLEGYSPLRHTNLRDPRLVEIAEAHRVTPAQAVLRWHVEHRIVAIPKSTNPERIAENAAIFGFRLTPSRSSASTGSADFGGAIGALPASVPYERSESSVRSKKPTTRRS